jgi:hypothetical protein
MLLDRNNIDELTVKLNADAEEELGKYAGSRELFDYHSYLGRILAQRARIAEAKADRKTSIALFDRAVEELNKALQANSANLVDRLLQKRVSQERAMLH